MASKRAAPGSRAALAELLLGVSKRLAAYDILDDVLQALVETVTREVGAERGTLFLNDPDTGELYSRVTQGGLRREIRFLNTTGVAGHVFQSGQPSLVDDAYADPRFNGAIDEQTGYRTRTIACVPIRTVKGEVIGVAQALNKKRGRFTRRDLALIEGITSQGAVALESTQFVERMKALRARELEFLEVVSDLSAEIKLGALLQRVMAEATRMLNAERSTLFLNDEKTGELWSEVGQGLEAAQIRMPNTLGIAGAVFTSGQSINIPHAYADLRFNPAFDRKTGFFTRSILCVPIVNKHARTIGVTQVLNKRGGPFGAEDESRLRAFTAQIAISLENAKLFADVQNMKNYSEAMLESMSNGVVTLDDEGRVATCNAAGLRILRARAESIVGQPASVVFGGANAWVLDKLSRLEATGKPEVTVDAALEAGGEAISANVTVLPLAATDGKRLGSMVLVEDISNEKRLKSTMARYMDPGIADQLLEAGGEALGGQSSAVTVLFSDIRSFTTITEQLGPQGTVAFLNEYFERMVEVIQREGGMLDKFIGDAIMAGFGVPVAHDDDADRSVRAAIGMTRALAAWNAERAEHGLPAVEIGIGVNTDTVVTGNIGSRKRMDYTMIGDGVNLAARLESACKQYGARILASDFTVAALKGTYRMRELDLVVVKGKTRPVAIYEILEHHTPATYPSLPEALAHFRDGLSRYREGAFGSARALFEKVLAINAGDAAARLYVERCARLAEKPPADWAGVWVMEGK